MIFRHIKGSKEFVPHFTGIPVIPVVVFLLTVVAGKRWYQ